MRFKVTVVVGLFVITVLTYGFFENSRNTATTRVIETERSQPAQAATSAAPIEQPFQVPERKTRTIESYPQPSADVIRQAVTENHAESQSANDAGAHRRSAPSTVASQLQPGQASAEYDSDMASLPPEANDPGVVYAPPEANDPGAIFAAPEADDLGIVFAAPEADDPGIAYPGPEFSEPGNQP